ncbi:MAG: LLM class flavin-dependent oxidoreductase [Candidatus Pseudobacter hemicellulosilyticus]|uniref:Luciferase-like monooxygenase n=1 Tax=Candidatus Pseudobacter hemicellulosilyticus TaxID=3121375 RepID=A0AAJ5WWD2_9BACT|nr:MAG: LLM class flavin-dependent oxidoreductase [Pseudobacter sp.]
MKQLQLSVLDQTPVRRGSNAVGALQETVQLARLADKLGYTRYWLSEHHNTGTLAGSAPEVLIARLGSETRQIRFGSGGIMLPNHSTLKVAENFRLLEALYPGRIDLGIGRAPGGDRLTAQLLNPSNTFDPQEYIRQIDTLQALLTDQPAAGNAQGKVRAMPFIQTEPALWMLTSSGESAYLAAHFGMALSYAQFINPLGGPEAMANYRQRFVPSDQWPAPTGNVGIFAFTSDDERKVEEVQTMMDYRLLSFEKGRFEEVITYDMASSYDYSPGEWQRVLFNRNRMIVGTPDVVKEKMTALADAFQVNELVIATFTELQEDRLRSYELMAQLFELPVQDAQEIF